MSSLLPVPAAQQPPGASQAEDEGDATDREDPEARGKELQAQHETDKAFEKVQGLQKCPGKGVRFGLPNIRCFPEDFQCHKKKKINNEIFLLDVELTPAYFFFS